LEKRELLRRSQTRIDLLLRCQKSATRSVRTTSAKVRISRTMVVGVSLVTNGQAVLALYELAGTLRFSAGCATRSRGEAWWSQTGGGSEPTTSWLQSTRSLQLSHGLQKTMLDGPRAKIAPTSQPSPIGSGATAFVQAACEPKLLEAGSWGPGRLELRPQAYQARDLTKLELHPNAYLKDRELLARNRLRGRMSAQAQAPARFVAKKRQEKTKTAKSANGAKHPETLP